MSRFETTHWSTVLKAGGEGAEARTALEVLCQRYRAPVLSYLQRHGRSDSDAQDLTQAFFERLIRLRLHNRADPARGRFRSFLLTALENFVRDEHLRATRIKRGGATVTHSLDATDNTDGDASDSDTPEADFDRQWAFSVLDGAVARLAAQCERNGKGDVFRALKAYVVEPADHDSYRELAAELGSRPNTIAAAVQRLRQSLRNHIREELADTVESNHEVDAELATLREALAFAAASRA
ncbi:MAG TPA: sigma-70 family RNA polymerase sigma factor [Rudaea sp.]|nr:sigma-70 family RNA polymerase sigma factor [Rudaea sp.]